MTARRATSASAGTPRRMTSDSRGWWRTAPHSPPLSEPGLSRMQVGDAELADVVQQRRAAQSRGVAASRPERRGDAAAISATPAYGARCRATWRRPCSRTPRRRDPAARRRRARPGRRARRPGRRAPSRRSRTRLALEHADARRRARGRTSAAPAAGDVDAAAAPPCCQKNSMVCARQAMRAAARSPRRRGRPGGRAVPVLEELADRGGGILVEADSARDLRPALAAHALQLADAAVAHRHDGAQVPDALAQRRPGRHVASQVAERQRGRLVSISRLSRLTCGRHRRTTSAVAAAVVEQPASLSSSA